MDKELLLEKYFTGNLTISEQQFLEKLLLEDTDFTKEFRFQNELRLSLTTNERLSVKKKLKKLEQNIEKKNKLKQVLYIAASLIIIAGVSLWLFFPENNKKNLYKQYYQVYPNTITPTVRSKTTNDLKANAFLAYDTQQYTLAQSLFDSLYTLHKEDYALFYQGIALMELNRFKEAALLLSQYPDNGSLYLYAIWYEALCYVAIGSTTSAIPLLQFLSEENNPIQAKATSLYTSLKK